MSKKIYQLSDDQMAVLSSDLIEAINYLNGSNSNQKGLLQYMNETLVEIKLEKQKESQFNLKLVKVYSLISFLIGLLISLIIYISILKNDITLFTNEYLQTMLYENNILISIQSDKLILHNSHMDNFQKFNEEYFYIQLSKNQ